MCVCVCVCVCACILGVCYFYKKGSSCNISRYTFIAICPRNKLNSLMYTLKHRHIGLSVVLFFFFFAVDGLHHTS